MPRGRTFLHYETAAYRHGFRRRERRASVPRDFRSRLRAGVRVRSVRSSSSSIDFILYRNNDVGKKKKCFSTGRNSVVSSYHRGVPSTGPHFHIDTARIQTERKIYEGSLTCIGNVSFLLFTPLLRPRPEVVHRLKNNCKLNLTQSTFLGKHCCIKFNAA